ncbi:Kinesin-like protein KIN-1 [Linum grandiflorum]
MNQEIEATPPPKKQTANVTVCSRFRPLSSKERRDHGGRVCVRRVDGETFVLKDEKDEDFTFSFDRVFYEDSLQADVYEFLALPIVKDAVNGVNGTIIAYGQTGAGKTYSMEGPDVLKSDDMQKGLLPRVVDGLFDHIASAGDSSKYKIKLSMVEIYMERVRDLFDLAKDNLVIKQSKENGMLVSGVTEANYLVRHKRSFAKPTSKMHFVWNLSFITFHVLKLRFNLQSGILNRAVGETQQEMNQASSRSHCAYIFTVQQELTRERTRAGKLVLVDLAGSEKVEKTGAEGKLLEEAKTINKSLSALGNVINALTCSSSKPSHVPYRDSKLTRLLQDALGGNSRTALICCCSPSSSNSSETFSTLRFGTRAKHIKTSALAKQIIDNEETEAKKHGADVVINDEPERTPAKKTSPTGEVGSQVPKKDECRETILAKLSERLDEEEINLLEEILVLEGILFDPDTAIDSESELEDITTRTISLLQQSLQELMITCEELKSENKALKARIAAGRVMDDGDDMGNGRSLVEKVVNFLFRWNWPAINH